MARNKGKAFNDLNVKILIMSKEMVELMKIRDERKARVRERESNKKAIWTLVGGAAGCFGIWLIIKFFWGDLAEEYSKLNKWINGFFIAMIVLFLLGAIIRIVWHSNFNKEIERLEKREKDLENSIR